jgi:hypothetical protein
LEYEGRGAMTEFIGFPKISRLSRDVIITEKIDGTNAQIYIGPVEEDNTNCIWQDGTIKLCVGSRTRWITPENDNHGFAKWCYEHVEELLELGHGRHFGEWWGQGIQRGYGLKEKRFSLFNVQRWYDDSVRPLCCHVVPAIWRGMFNLDEIDRQMQLLNINGSVAASGFMKPEGIVIYHIAGNVAFKKTLNGDGHKGEH